MALLHCLCLAAAVCLAASQTSAPGGWGGPRQHPEGPQGQRPGGSEGQAHPFLDALKQKIDAAQSQGQDRPMLIAIKEKIENATSQGLDHPAAVLSALQETLNGSQVNHPWLNAVKERLEARINGSQGWPHHSGAGDWRPQDWANRNHTHHFGRPLFFNHGPQGSQGHHGQGPEQGPEQGPNAADNSSDDMSDPASDFDASPAPAQVLVSPTPRFGPPVTHTINSPEEAGGKPVGLPQKHQRWANVKKTSPATAPATPAPAVPASPAPVAKPSTGKDGSLNVCTWNIFRFGQAKFQPEPMAKFKKDYGKDKLEMIGEQVQNADIIAIQEYFDTTDGHDIMNVVTEYLNRTTGSKWGMSVGPRVGRGSKEQYVFLYRTELASVIKESVAPEPAGKDPYSREPWFAQFKISKPSFSMPTLTLGTIHTEPEYAVREMNALDEYTFPWAETTFNTKDVMVLGDYNADCQYVRKSDWASVTLFTKNDYTWFIPTGVDTASMQSECTFDRAVTRSPKIKASFVPGSLRVLDFVSQYKIVVAEARQLSDHFPVCMKFK